MSGQTRTPIVDSVLTTPEGTQIVLHGAVIEKLERVARALEIENSELKQALLDINCDAWSGDITRLRSIARRSDSALLSK